ncbi:MAG: polysaccharide deacetylase family protein [Candidatus Peribacteraceae bacterium]|jgi:peptidoglycan/xylan/chitin deacetylase (PgdA/CDA1 family)
MPLLNGTDLLPSIGHTLEDASLPRTAVLTCDIEPDYGGRTGTAELLREKRFTAELMRWCGDRSLPLSAFVVTSLLGERLPAVDALRDGGIDVHCHAHTHNVRTYFQHSREEIARSQEAFTAFFGASATGYRAPQGILLPGDDTALAQNGFLFDSSVFPGRRPGLFDCRTLPLTPWEWRSGVLELPLAATARRRLLTLSHLKLRGKTLWQSILRQDALPPILIVDSHLHDFFPPSSAAGLPWTLRLAYARNRTKGFALLEWLLDVLRERGYRFQSMTGLAQTLREALRA